MEVCSIMSVLNVVYNMNSDFEIKFELYNNENLIKYTRLCCSCC